MKIYAPNKQANGVYASVLFINGVGETNNPRLIEWFKTHGYELEECHTASENSPEKCEIHHENPLENVLELIQDDAEPKFEEMTPIELRQWATEHGYGSKIRNIRSKEKLIEIIRG